MEIRVALPSILMASAYRESLFPSFCARPVWLHLSYISISLSWASAAFSALIYAALFFWLPRQRERRISSDGKGGKLNKSSK